MAGMKNFAPLIVAIVLLLLPLLYVGSYLAMVFPNPYAVRREFMGISPSETVISFERRNYRSCETACSCIFWPLEQIDRKVRPMLWKDPPTLEEIYFSK